MKLRTAVTVAILQVGPVVAGTIFVDNASFETLPSGGLPTICSVATGCSYSDALIPGQEIPGWIVNTTQLTGQLQPGSSGGNTTFFDSVPDGLTVAYTNGGTISQAVAAAVQLGVTYTLLVDVGQRNDCCTYGAVDLVIGTNRIAATGASPNPGLFSTFTATYTGLAGDVGKSIGIELAANGPQGVFDNVRLSDSTVPEPGSIVLVGLGLTTTLAVLFKSRHRRS
jgi:hypothetical protein